MEYEVCIISADETLALRQAILRPHQKTHECVFTHDTDAESFHLGAFVDKRLIAIASFLKDSHPDLPQPESQFRIRGMATLPEYQRQGIGMALLSEGISRVKQSGATRLWCNARETALGFYQRAGFAIFGERFELPGIGAHFAMWREV